MKAAIAIAAFATLAACTATIPPPNETPPVRDIEGSCRREPGQRFIGMRASAEVGRQMLAATGAKILRWVPPRTAVTMDFSPDRLTVSYDDDYRITSVSCT